MHEVDDVDVVDEDDESSDFLQPKMRNNGSVKAKNIFSNFIFPLSSYGINQNALKFRQNHNLDARHDYSPPHPHHVKLIFFEILKNIQIIVN